MLAFSLDGINSLVVYQNQVVLALPAQDQGRPERVGAGVVTGISMEIARMAATRSSSETHLATEDAISPVHESNKGDDCS